MQEKNLKSLLKSFLLASISRNNAVVARSSSGATRSHDDNLQDTYQIQDFLSSFGKGLSFPFHFQKDDHIHGVC